MVLRAAVWKSTRQPQLVGLWAVVVWALAALASGFLREYVESSAPIRFVPYGVNASVAAVVLSLAVAAVFVRQEGRATVLSAMMMLSIPMTLAGAIIALATGPAPFDPPEPSFWEFVTGALFFLVSLVWWIGAMFTILRSIEPNRRFTLWRTGALCAVLLLVSVAMPYQPAFRGPNFDIRKANYWEFVPAMLAGSFDRTPPRPRVNRAQVELAQPALLDAAFSHLMPQVKGKADIYTIGLAGSSDQDVFVKEMNGGLESLARVFALDGRVVRLANHFDTANTLPAASRQNFAATVRAVAQIMDRDEDVLLLFMTSHGSNNGVSLVLAGAFYADLSPTDVATVLDREGIKNRIVIVSACYSGVFLKPLANENTIVITAADEDHPSFGCSNDREWTYFGDALFSHSLRPGGNIEEAFLDAKVAIAQWEARDGVTPSNPQGYFGHVLMDKLAPLYPISSSKNAMMSTDGQ